MVNNVDNKNLELVKIMERAAAIIQEEAVRMVQAGNIPPPLKPSTIKKKGSSKTLIDEGWLLGALQTGLTISFKKDRITAAVGIFDPEVTRYAIIHEFGGTHVPQRAFLRPAFDAKIEEVQNYIIEQIKKMPL